MDIVEVSKHQEDGLAAGWLDPRGAPPTLLLSASHQDWPPFYPRTRAKGLLLALDLLPSKGFKVQLVLFVQVKEDVVSCLGNASKGHYDFTGGEASMVTSEFYFLGFGTTVEPRVCVCGVEEDSGGRRAFNKVHFHPRPLFSTHPTAMTKRKINTTAFAVSLRTCSRIICN